MKTGEETNNDRQSLRNKVIVLGLLVLGLALVLSPAGRLAYDAALTPINSKNIAYLKQSQADSLKVMAPIVGAKAIADAVEGSTIAVKPFGVGADVEIGDLIQPLLDALNIAWKGSCISLAYGTIAKYLLQGSYSIAKPFIIVFLASWLIHLLAAPYRASVETLAAAIKRIRDFTLLVSLTFLLVMPITVLFSASLSKAITSPLETEIIKDFEELAHETNLDGYRDREGYKEKAEFIFGKSQELVKWYLWDAQKKIISSSVKWLVLKVLNGIVFPLASLAFLIWMVRDVLYPTIGLSEKGMGSADLRELRRFLTAKRAEAWSKEQEEKSEREGN